MPTSRHLVHRTLRPAVTCLSLFLLSAPVRLPAADLALQQSWCGEKPGDQFSFSMTEVGDVNKDGLVDVVIGANVNDAGAPAGGKAYLHLGAAVAFAVAPIGCLGSLANEQLGKSVAGGADLNGDGVDDWVVGAPGIGNSGTHAGRVHVYWGGAVPDGHADLLLEGTTASGGFGEAVTILADFDGDGFADVAVGAPRDGDGKVFLYRGGPQMDAIADATLSAGVDDRRFGAALTSLQDQNNDGRCELVIGSPRSSRSATWAGAAFVVWGTTASSPQADLVLLGANAGDEFGASLVRGADLNGDAYADLLVGAPAANPTGLVDAGAAYGFFCGPSLDAQADLVLAGENAGDRFGTSMAAGFFWDEDAYADFAIGAPFADTQFQDAGVCAVFLGGVAADAVPDAVLLGDAPQQQFASSMTGVHASQQTGFLLVGDSYLSSGRAQVFAAVRSPTDVSTPWFPESRLQPPWPNPFNPHVATRLHIASAGRWSVQVFDSNGRRIAVLLEDTLEPGTHDLRWNGLTQSGRRAASGIYWIRAQGPQRSHSARITLVR